MNKNIYYSWNQFDADCERLAHWAQGFAFKNIFGIPRAGMVVAVKVSHLLNIPLITDPHEISHPETLVVDDIVITGETISVLEEHVGDFLLATLFWSGSGSEPDYYVRKREGNIIFPWETKSDSFFEESVSRSIAIATSIKLGESIKVDKKGIA